MKNGFDHELSHQVADTLQTADQLSLVRKRRFFKKIGRFFRKVGRKIKRGFKKVGRFAGKALGYLPKKLLGFALKKAKKAVMGYIRRKLPEIKAKAKRN